VDRRRYRVLIAYTEDHPDHPGKVFQACVEVDASSPEEAEEVGIAEFHELAKVSGSSWRRRIIRGEIKVQEMERVEKETRFRTDTSELAPGIAMCALHGIADTYAMPELQSAIHDAIASGASALIVDLAETSYMNSSCIGLLVGHLDEIRIVLVGTPDKIGRIFKMLGIDSLFDSYRTPTDALRALM